MDFETNTVKFNPAKLIAGGSSCKLLINDVIFGACSIAKAPPKADEAPKEIDVGSSVNDSAAQSTK